MSHVLVPLDGTKNAEAAIAALEQLCAPEDQIVLLVVEKPEARHQEGYRPGPVVTADVAGPGGGIAGAAMPDRPRYAETTDQVLQRQTDEWKDYLEQLATGLRGQGRTVQTEIVVHEHADQAIIEYARRTQPKFIAMLRRTHNRFSDALFGNTASSVAKSGVAPVLFVPDTTNEVA